MLLWWQLKIAANCIMRYTATRVKGSGGCTALCQNQGPDKFDSSGSTLTQIMACCLVAPSHYLNQCWLIITKFQWHSSEGNFTIDILVSSHWTLLENYLSKICFRSPVGQWVKDDTWAVQFSFDTFKNVQCTSALLKWFYFHQYHVFPIGSTILNSLWPGDAAWRHWFGSLLAQVMACFLMAPSHYLNQCWLIISEVHWQSAQGNFTRQTSVINYLL